MLHTMKIRKDSLHWSPSCVRFHDAKNGRWIGVAPRPSEVAALLWCAARGVEFVKAYPLPASAAVVAARVCDRTTADLRASCAVLESSVTR
jgi:hypothetical protein